MLNNQSSIFKKPELEKQFMDVYESVLNLWSVSHEALDVRTRFGITHINVCGSIKNPPMILLPGFGANSTMWFPNVGALNTCFRTWIGS